MKGIPGCKKSALAFKNRNKTIRILYGKEQISGKERKTKTYPR